MLDSGYFTQSQGGVIDIAEDIPDETQDVQGIAHDGHTPAAETCTIIEDDKNEGEQALTTPVVQPFPQFTRSMQLHSQYRRLYDQGTELLEWLSELTKENLDTELCQIIGQFKNCLEYHRRATESVTNNLQHIWVTLHLDGCGSKFDYLAPGNLTLERLTDEMPPMVRQLLRNIATTSTSTGPNLQYRLLPAGTLTHDALQQDSAMWSCLSSTTVRDVLNSSSAIGRPQLDFELVMISNNSATAVDFEALTKTNTAQTSPAPVLPIFHSKSIAETSTVSHPVSLQHPRDSPPKRAPKVKSIYTTRQPDTQMEEQQQGHNDPPAASESAPPEVSVQEQTAQPRSDLGITVYADVVESMEPARPAAEIGAHGRSIIDRFASRASLRKRDPRKQRKTQSLQIAVQLAPPTETVHAAAHSPPEKTWQLRHSTSPQRTPPHPLPTPLSDSVIKRNIRRSPGTVSPPTREPAQQNTHSAPPYTPQRPAQTHLPAPLGTSVNTTQATGSAGSPVKSRQVTSRSTGVQSSDKAQQSDGMHPERIMEGLRPSRGIAMFPKEHEEVGPTVTPAPAPRVTKRERDTTVEASDGDPSDASAPLVANFANPGVQATRGEGGGAARGGRVLPARVAAIPQGQAARSNAQRQRFEWKVEDVLLLLQGMEEFGTSWRMIQEKHFPNHRGTQMQSRMKDKWRVLCKGHQNRGSVRTCLPEAVWKLVSTLIKSHCVLT